MPAIRRWEQSVGPAAPAAAGHQPPASHPADGDRATEEYPTEAATSVDVAVNPMHGTNPHPPRTTNRDRPRPSGDGVAEAAATADAARAGTEAYEGLRAPIDHETDPRTMTHTHPAFDDARRDGTGTRPAGVTAP